MNILIVRESEILNIKVRSFLSALFVCAARALLYPSSLELGERWHS
jgi:hypothetical protein